MFLSGSPWPFNELGYCGFSAQYALNCHVYTCRYTLLQKGCCITPSIKSRSGYCMFPIRFRVGVAPTRETVKTAWRHCGWWYMGGAVCSVCLIWWPIFNPDTFFSSPGHISPVSSTPTDLTSERERAVIRKLTFRPALLNSVLANRADQSTPRVPCTTLIATPEYPNLFQA